MRAGSRAAILLLVLALSCAASGCGESPPTGAAAGTPNPASARLADLVQEAKAKESVGDRRGAEEAWDRALAIEPGHASALYASARLRRARGDLRGALERIQACISQEPNAGRGRLLAAEILSDPRAGILRDLGRAEAFVREALARNPEESGPHLALGRVLLLRGRLPEANGCLTVAARMNPRDPDSRSLLGVIALREGRDEDAGSWFRGALGSAAPALPHGLPGEGDTERTLDRVRPLTCAELRAVAGLAVLGGIPSGARQGNVDPRVLRIARAALDERGTGEAALDRDEEGLLDSVVVRNPGGKVALAAWDGASVVVLVGE